MRREILIAGRGGQGILLLGHVLGLAAAKYSGLYTTGTESYSAETRGGDSRADLIICTSPEELDYMKVRKAEIALFMYPEQLRKYASLLKDDAQVFADSTFISKEDIDRVKGSRSWRVESAPYTEIARERLGTHRVANMVALGHLIKLTKLVPPEAIESAIKEVVNRKWVEIDIKAFRAGLEIGIKKQR